MTPLEVAQVRELGRQALAAERERCAKIAEAGIEFDGKGLPAIQALDYSHAFARNRVRTEIAAAIRSS